MDIGANVEFKRRYSEAFLALVDGSAAIVRAGGESEWLASMCRALVEKGGFRRACILGAESDPGMTLRPLVSCGAADSGTDALETAWASAGQGLELCETAIRTARPAVSGADAHLVSTAAIPLKVGTSVFGALVVASTKAGAFDAGEIDFLVTFADVLSAGMDLRRACAERSAFNEVLEANLRNTVHALATVFEFRDPLTANHQRNVATLAVAIGRELSLPEYELEGIRLGGLLHDIGKIKVPQEIGSKPGRLTLPEIQIIQTHADAGYAILKHIAFPWPVAEMVRQHHERIDGSGYPKGLSGDEILPGAKIIAVADVLEAMMAHRAYRPALGQAAAIAELTRGRGLQLDAAAVDACIAIVQRPGFADLFRHGGNDLDSGPASAGRGAFGEWAPGANQSDHAPRLTLQQSSVLRLLAQGKSVDEVAQYMNISVRSVRTHLGMAGA